MIERAENLRDSMELQRMRVAAGIAQLKALPEA